MYTRYSREPGTCKAYTLKGSIHEKSQIKSGNNQDERLPKQSCFLVDEVEGNEIVPREPKRNLGRLLRRSGPCRRILCPVAGKIGRQKNRTFKDCPWKTGRSKTFYAPYLTSRSSFSLSAQRSSIFLVSECVTFSSSSTDRLRSSSLIFFSFSSFSIASLMSRRMLRTAVR